MNKQLLVNQVYGLGEALRLAERICARGREAASTTHLSALRLLAAEATAQGPTVTTISGRALDLLRPNAELLDVHDIALALSRLPRWVGHTRQFYSVAQHSVWVSRWVCALADMPESRELALSGLLHDAAEAYIGDIITPVKRLYPQIIALERAVLEAICQRFGLAWPLPPEVKVADTVAAATEAAQLRPGVAHELDCPPLEVALEPMSPELAEAAFLRRFEELWG